MTRRLHVVYSVSRYVSNAIDGQRLRVEVDEAEDITTKVFAYLAQPLSSIAAVKRGQFDHICSPADLEDFPEDAPTVGVLPEWFRLNYVDLVLRSADAAEECLALILEDLRRLKRTLGIMDTLITEEDTWIDTAPDEEESESSESSESI